MTRRTLREREELLRGGGTATLDRPRGKNVRDHLLSLQRDYGNTAVTGMVVQRRDRPQSTDAPGTKKKKAPPAKKGPSDEEKYIPKLNPSLGTDANELMKSGADALGHAEDPAIKDPPTKKFWFAKAAHYYEQAYLNFTNKAAYRGAAMYVYKSWKGYGDDPRAAFWSKVSHGEIDPKAPKAEDMTGKEF